ncbi:MAG: SRPBCC family protein, partial [Acidimicrobiia bacterium]
YDLIADVTRMGEWSPACTGATWDEGAGPTVGSWFTGHNVIEDDRTYDSRCEITDAERPSTIAWMQGGKDLGVTEWRYTFTPTDAGTEVTESWTVLRPFPPDRVDDDRARMLKVRFGEAMEETLAKFKASAEA